MLTVIGIRFKNVGKIYYFDPLDISFSVNDSVIVETSRGIEFGTVVIKNKKIEPESITLPLKPIIRPANKNDILTISENTKKEEQALIICQDKIAKHKLSMKLISAEYTFDNSKILFYFTADGRVDFRDLVKDLASIFKTRIELRQIGVRDQSKVIGGLGICGRELCCSTFLDEFHPVSIKMAKEQGLSLNPTKISGTCGRLMCCLKYEQESYEDLLKTTPKVGAIIKTATNERGVVIDVNLLTGKLTVRLDSQPDSIPQVFNKADIILIKDAKIQINKEELAALSELEDK